MTSLNFPDLVSDNIHEWEKAIQTIKTTSDKSIRASMIDEIIQKMPSKILKTSYRNIEANPFFELGGLIIDNFSELNSTFFLIFSSLMSCVSIAGEIRFSSSTNAFLIEALLKLTESHPNTNFSTNYVASLFLIPSFVNNFVDTCIVDFSRMLFSNGMDPLISRVFNDIFQFVVIQNDVSNQYSTCIQYLLDRILEESNANNADMVENITTFILLFTRKASKNSGNILLQFFVMLHGSDIVLQCISQYPKMITNFFFSILFFKAKDSQDGCLTNVFAVNVFADYIERQMENLPILKCILQALLQVLQTKKISFQILDEKINFVQLFSLKTIKTNTDPELFSVFAGILSELSIINYPKSSLLLASMMGYTSFFDNFSYITPFIIQLVEDNEKSFAIDPETLQGFEFFFLESKSDKIGHLFSEAPIYIDLFLTIYFHSKDFKELLFSKLMLAAPYIVPVSSFLTTIAIIFEYLTWNLREYNKNKVTSPKSYNLISKREKINDQNEINYTPLPDYMKYTDSIKQEKESQAVENFCNENSNLFSSLELKDKSKINEFKKHFGESLKKKPKINKMQFDLIKSHLMYLYELMQPSFGLGLLKTLIAIINHNEDFFDVWKDCNGCSLISTLLNYSCISDDNVSDLLLALENHTFSKKLNLQISKLPPEHRFFKLRKDCYRKVLYGQAHMKPILLPSLLPFLDFPPEFLTLTDLVNVSKYAFPIYIRLGKNIPHLTKIISRYLLPEYFSYSISKHVSLFADINTDTFPVYEFYPKTNKAIIHYSTGKHPFYSFSFWFKINQFFNDMTICHAGILKITILANKQAQIKWGKSHVILPLKINEWNFVYASSNLWIFEEDNNFYFNDFQTHFSEEMLFTEITFGDISVAQPFPWYISSNIRIFPKINHHVNSLSNIIREKGPGNLNTNILLKETQEISNNKSAQPQANNTQVPILNQIIGPYSEGWMMSKYINFVPYQSLSTLLKYPKHLSEFFKEMIKCTDSDNFYLMIYDLLFCLRINNGKKLFPNFWFNFLYIFKSKISIISIEHFNLLFQCFLFDQNGVVISNVSTLNVFLKDLEMWAKMPLSLMDAVYNSLIRYLSRFKQEVTTLFQKGQNYFLIFKRFESNINFFYVLITKIVLDDARRISTMNFIIRLCALFGFNSDLNTIVKSICVLSDQSEGISHDVKFQFLASIICFTANNREFMNNVLTMNNPYFQRIFDSCPENQIDNYLSVFRFLNGKHYDVTLDFSFAVVHQRFWKPCLAYITPSDNIIADQTLVPSILTMTLQSFALLTRRECDERGQKSPNKLPHYIKENIAETFNIICQTFDAHPEYFNQPTVLSVLAHVIPLAFYNNDPLNSISDDIKNTTFTFNYILSDSSYKSSNDGPQENCITVDLSSLENELIDFYHFSDREIAIKMINVQLQETINNFPKSTTVLTLEFIKNQTEKFFSNFGVNFSDITTSTVNINKLLQNLGYAEFASKIILIPKIPDKYFNILILFEPFYTPSSSEKGIDFNISYILNLILLSEMSTEKFFQIIKFLQYAFSANKISSLVFQDFLPNFTIFLNRFSSIKHDNFIKSSIPYLNNIINKVSEILPTMSSTFDNIRQYISSFRIGSLDTFTPSKPYTIEDYFSDLLPIVKAKSRTILQNERLCLLYQKAFSLLLSTQISIHMRRMEVYASMTWRDLLFNSLSEKDSPFFSDTNSCTRIGPFAPPLECPRVSMMSIIDKISFKSDISSMSNLLNILNLHPKNQPEPSAQLPETFYQYVDPSTYSSLLDNIPSINFLSFLESAKVQTVEIAGNCYFSRFNQHIPSVFVKAKGANEKSIIFLIPQAFIDKIDPKNPLLHFIPYHSNTSPDEILIEDSTVNHEVQNSDQSLNESQTSICLTDESNPNADNQNDTEEIESEDSNDESVDEKDEDSDTHFDDFLISAYSGEYGKEFRNFAGRPMFFLQPNQCTWVKKFKSGYALHLEFLFSASFNLEFNDISQKDVDFIYRLFSTKDDKGLALNSYSPELDQLLKDLDPVKAKRDWNSRTINSFEFLSILNALDERFFSSLSQPNEPLFPLLYTDDLLNTQNIYPYDSTSDLRISFSGTHFVNPEAFSTADFPISSVKRIISLNHNELDSFDISLESWMPNWFSPELVEAAQLSKKRMDINQKVVESNSGQNQNNENIANSSGNTENQEETNVKNIIPQTSPKYVVFPTFKKSITIKLIRNPVAYVTLFLHSMCMMFHYIRPRDLDTTPFDDELYQNVYKVSPKFFMATSMSASLGSGFLVIDFNFGITSVYQIEYERIFKKSTDSGKRPCGLHRISDFSTKEEAKSVIDGKDFIVASVITNRILLWDFPRQILIKTLNFDVPIMGCLFNEIKGYLWVWSQYFLMVYTVNGSELAVEKIKQTCSIKNVTHFDPDEGSIKVIFTDKIQKAAYGLDSGTIVFVNESEKLSSA